MKIIAKSIHHLGIVSGICDEIELEKTIDTLIPKQINTKLSMGTRIKAMVINGLGFTGRALYLTTQFFEKKAIDLLLGKEVEPADLNDDALGRALDAIYEAGPEVLFSTVATRAVEIYKVKTNKLHLDTTSYSVSGEYEKGIGLMQFGYSKDLRKDLKQMILSSFATNDGAIPLMVQVLPGNTSDAKHFKEVLHALKDNILTSQEDFMVTFDAAGYNAETIAGMGDTKWTSRVPDTIKEARELKKNTPDNAFVKMKDGYSFVETSSEYAGIKQRWILIQSQKAFAREQKTIARGAKKEAAILTKKLNTLGRKKFSSVVEAQTAFDDVIKKIKYHQVQLTKIVEEKKFIKKGKPKPNSPFKIVYKVTTTVNLNVDEIEKIAKFKSKFIVATNELDKEKFGPENTLVGYKGQAKAEGQFRFLKNPLCMANSVYLKNEKRIIALAIVMFICLLVYAIAERALRAALVEKNETVLNQINKPVQNPTMKCVFQKMEDLIVVTYSQADKLIVEVKNLTSELVKIITFLGKACMAKYLIPITSTA